MFFQCVGQQTLTYAYFPIDLQETRATRVVNHGSSSSAAVAFHFSEHKLALPQTNLYQISLSQVCTFKVRW